MYWNSHVFLPQILYHKSRGRDKKYMPGFSFKLYGCKNPTSPFIQMQYMQYMQCSETHCQMEERMQLSKETSKLYPAGWHGATLKKKLQIYYTSLVIMTLPWK